MSRDELQRLFVELRPALHRYCARMMGSTFDGEDIVQDVLARAMIACHETQDIGNFRAWLYAIAHNACIDALRSRRRRIQMPLDEGADIPDETAADPVATVYGFRTFLRLPELQRAAVILKDVLGHSLEEVATITSCTLPAAKSALQRGRASLNEIARQGDDVLLPLLNDDERQRLFSFVAMFRAGDFDGIRALLAEDVRLDLVARLELCGKENVQPYFTRYGEIDHWRFAPGILDGKPVMLVFDGRRDVTRPAHIVSVGWSGNEIATIRDTLFAPYALDGADWLQLEMPV